MKGSIKGSLQKRFLPLFSVQIFENLYLAVIILVVKEYCVMNDFCVRYEPGDPGYVVDHCYYRELFTLVDVAIVVHNLDGIIVDINDYCLNVLQLESEDGIGTDVYRFFEPQYRDMMRDKFDELKNGCNQYAEVEIHKSSGESFFAELIFRRITVKDKVYIIEIITDVSGKKGVEAELKTNEELFSSLFESLTDIYFRSDMNGMITMISPSVAALLEYEPYELTGEKLEKLFSSPEDCHRLRMSVKEYGFAEDFEVDLRTSDDDKITVSITGSYIYNEYEEPIGIQGFMRDISDRKAAENALRESREELREINKKLFLASRTDPLTGIPNRRDMMEKLSIESSKENPGLCIIIADLDKFKSVNDTYGHDMGDEVLIEIAKVMKSCLPENGHICRWGGEEFCIMLPSTNIEEGMKIAEVIRAAVEKTSVNYDGISLNVTVTMGISEYKSGASVDECIKNADAALYDGKSRGRNRVVLREFE